MHFTEQELQEYIEENDVKFIRLTFCDTFGTMKNIAIMPRELHRAMQDGIAFDASGLLESAHRSLLLIPEPATLSVLPWRPQSGRVVRLFCKLRHMDGSPYAGDLRRNLRLSMRELRDKGYSCEMGTRCEFYLFETDMNGKPTQIPVDHAGYLDVAPLDRCENTRREISLALDEMGLNPTSSCHKHGPGQNEIDFAWSNPLTAADNMVHYKTVVKTIAAQNGQYASFMPRPLPDECGSAMKITLCIRKNGRSIFGSSRDTLTQEGCAFIAGILNRVQSFTLFSNPTINSYERFAVQTAPNQINWSDENRVPLIQLLYAPGQDGSIEVRSADAYCNPYITFMMLLKAGLAGIEAHEELTAATNAAQENSRFNKLPATLKEAIRLAKSSEFVRQVLPESVIADFCRSMEAVDAAYEAAPDQTAFCLERYF